MNRSPLIREIDRYADRSLRLMCGECFPPHYLKDICMRWHPLAIFLVFGLVGCGGVSTVPVSGKIILDGKPLAGATVTFTPFGDDRNPGPASAGLTDDKGEYSLALVTDASNRGAVRGKHKVKISAMEGGSDGAAGADPKPRVDKVPAEYNLNSGLIFEVPEGGTTSADFKLDSGMPMPK
jgi:hypothetical protein